MFIDFIIASQFEKFKIIGVCCNLGLSKITIMGCNFLAQLSYDTVIILNSLPKSIVKKNHGIHFTTVHINAYILYILWSNT